MATVAGFDAIVVAEPVVALVALVLSRLRTSRHAAFVHGLDLPSAYGLLVWMTARSRAHASSALHWRRPPNIREHCLQTG